MTHADNPRRNSHGGGQRQRPLALPPLISFFVVVLLLIGWISWPYGFEFVGMMGWGTPWLQLNCCVLRCCVCVILLLRVLVWFLAFCKKRHLTKNRGILPDANSSLNVNDLSHILIPTLRGTGHYR